jgi:hypothetical protein
LPTMIAIRKSGIFAWIAVVIAIGAILCYLVFGRSGWF